MRLIARIGLALAAVVLVAPATAMAQSQAALSKPWNQVFHRHKKKTADTAKPARLCTDCNRELVKKRDGVDIPPAPPLPAGMAVNAGACTKCKKPIMVVREEVMPPPSYFNVGSPGSNAPAGVAVASDEPQLGPGMIASAEPLPIGIYQPKLAAAPSMARLGMPGTGDPSVMPTSGVASPASTPLGGPGHNRPHVVSHLFGFSEIGKQRAEDRERRALEKHASIQYGPAAQTVTELPAKMVYGK